MSLFKSRCELCGVKISKGKEVFKEVKVPEFSGTKKSSFCSEEHGNKFKYEVMGTKRTNYCPSCGV